MEVGMKVRCNLCGKIFPSETEYLDGEHDKRVHDRAEPTSFAQPLLTHVGQSKDLKAAVTDVDELR
jgi:hypothetical protein